MITTRSCHTLWSRASFCHWALPHWQEAEIHYWQSTLRVNVALRQHVGIKATMLRCLATDRSASTGRIARLYEMERMVPYYLAMLT